MRGVGALPSASHHETALSEALQHAIEEERLGVALHETAPELAQHRVVESGIGQLQRERILPIDARTDRVSGLAVREILQELEDRDQSQTPWWKAPLASCGKERGEIFVLVDGSELVTESER